MIDMNILKEFNTTVLYVEDNDEIRESVHQGLKLALDNIFIAKDGQEGLEIFQENRQKIDLIISDINMPNLNGIEMSKEIKNISSNIPIIFTSAHNDSEYLLQAIELGINAFVQKPIDIVVLLEKIIYTLMPVFQERDLKIKQNTISKQIAELEQFKEIIDEHSIVIKTDIEGKITYVNNLFTQVSGFSKEEILTHGAKLFKHPSNTKYFFTNMWKTILNKEVWRGVMKNINKDKKTFYLSYSIFPITNHSGDIIEFYGIGTDVTQEKEYGVKMRQLNKQLMDKQNSDKEDIKETHSKEKQTISQQLSSALEKSKNLENLLIKHQNESQKIISKQESKIKTMNAKFKDLTENYIITKKDM
jgi:PAS domain S-box-containing protein